MTGPTTRRSDVPRPPVESTTPPPPPIGQPRQSPQRGLIERMVRDAHAHQASDIHIRVGEVPR